MIFTIVTIIDQLIKYIVVVTKCNISIIKNFIYFTYAENTGGIYGMFSGNNLVFAGITFVILACLFLFVKDDMKKSKPQSVLWQLIFAGGVSNLIDRCSRGYVVDFIQMKPFGIFNIADACIVISVCILIFLELKEIFSGKDRSKSK